MTSPLHPLTSELAAHYTGPRARTALIEQWKRIHGPDSFPPTGRLLGEYPLIASPALQQAVDVRVCDITSFARRRFAAQRNSSSMAAWTALSEPDVLCADLAIVKDLEDPQGWSLRWVEFQAFTSILATLHTMDLAAKQLWPLVQSLSFSKKPEAHPNWEAGIREWTVPSSGVLLEHNPVQQGTYFDLDAASRWLNLPIVQPQELHVTGTTVWHRGSNGRLEEIQHIFNRLVLHELGDLRANFEHKLGAAAVTWHSHPAWYYGFSKALLPELSQPRGQGATWLRNWRNLNRPATQLVAKNINSHGGHAVLLHVTEAILASLAPTDDWIVQPRYEPYPLLTASDGAPVYGEIRCIIARPCSALPWTCGQVMRLSRGAKVSVSTLTEEAGNGLALLYRPEGLE